MSLGARLAELRLRKGESLQAVATAIGISKTHVWQLEKGNSDNPSMELLKKLAEHFEVPLTYLADSESEASLDDVEAQQFFRDFKSLSDAERELLKHTLQVFKNKKAGGDGSA